MDTPTSGKIPADRLAQLHTAGVWAALQNGVTVVADNAAHGPGQYRKGEIRCVGWHLCCQCGYSHLRSRGGKAVIGAKAHKIAAALPGFNIPLVAKQGIGVLHRNGADPGLCRQDSLGGQLAAERVDPTDDTAAHLGVQLQIGRRIFSFGRLVVHLIIPFLLEFTLLYTQIIIYPFSEKATPPVTDMAIRVPKAPLVRGAGICEERTND